MPKAQLLCTQVPNRISETVLDEVEMNSFIALSGKGLGSLARSFMATDHGEVADKIKSVCRVSDELL